MSSAALLSLADAERFARELLWHTPHVAVFVFDTELKLRYAEGEPLRRFGYEPEVICGRRVSDVLPDPAWNGVAPLYGRVLAGEKFDCEFTATIGRTYQAHGTPIVEESTGRVLGGLLVTHETVTPAEERLAQQLRQQLAVAELGRLAISGAELGALVDEAGRLAFDTLGALVGAAIVELLPGGIEFVIRHESSGSLTGQRMPVAGSLPAAVLASHAPLMVPDVMASGPGFSAEFKALGARSAACVPIGRPDAPFGMLGVFSPTPFQFSDDDVIFLESLSNVLAEAVSRELADSERRHQAMHDVVTDLPNRALLEDRLRQALAFAERADLRVGVLFIDLDRFKVINDSLGHHAGDAVLRVVADRLRGILRASDTVARFGGDEFVIVATALENEQEAVRLAETVLGELAEPIPVADRHVHVRASIGICVASPHAHPDPHAVIRDADTAMYRAKARGRGRFEFVDPDASRGLVDRLRVEQELRHALEAGDLRLMFQPLVRMAERTTMGAEVLLRWQHPARGFLGPADFLDIAEQSGLMIPIGEWVLAQACRHAIRWSAADNFLLTVNLSAGQLADYGIVAAVARALEETGLSPSCLGLELTEHVLVGDQRDALRTLTALKALGVKLLLDDFGTGFSSLSHLKRFPIDVVKIDRSFIEGLTSPPGESDDLAIVSAIVGMSRATGKQVIPEGVETEGQVGALRRLGCDVGQGYLFSRPMSTADFDAWIGPPLSGVADL